MAIVKQQPDVLAYTGIYQMRCTAYKVAPDYVLIQSETCRASNGKLSLITRILCIFLIYIHIASSYTRNFFIKFIKTNNKIERLIKLSSFPVIYQFTRSQIRHAYNNRRLLLYPLTSRIAIRATLSTFGYIISSPLL